MRPVRSAFTELLARLLIAAALAALVLLTLIDRGATRIYATPWNGLFWFVQLAPIVVLAFRALLPTATTLLLPSPPWMFFALAFVSALELSAAFSPFRGISAMATCEPLAAIATFFVAHDWLTRDRQRNADTLLRAAGYFSGLLVLVSFLLWIFQDLRAYASSTDSLARLLRIQNAHPLGHTSYTAGLALLALPWPMVLALRERGRARLGWFAVGALALGMLLSSGSRGGVVGVAALAFAALWLARLNWRRMLLAALAALLTVGAGAYLHPRTRALLFLRPSTEVAPNLSNVQRAAMAKAGWLMGRDRPILGWGTGTTSRVYPKFRSQLDGGVEDALQLHSMPVQLWADLGFVGSTCLATLMALTIAAAIRGRRELGGSLSHGAFDAAILTLAGYGAFSLTDYQLDVPVFAFGLAVCVACVTALAAKKTGPAGVETQLPPPAKRGEVIPPTGIIESRALRYVVGAYALSPLVLIAAFAKPDPVPELNVRALELAANGAREDEAIALLRESLRLNSDQEIAHFNLGWLLVVREPAEAQQHFLAAAKLVPDKGGVYFGLALARINRGAAGDADQATRALALECLNDPVFLVSPWWKNPALSPLRAASVAQMQAMAHALATDAGQKPYVQREAEYLQALSEWLEGNHPDSEIVAHTNTDERKAYFSRNAARPDFADAKVRRYRRERTGYPILMRDLDLPAPVDVFDVQENDLAAGEYRFLFPAKGWAPSPELLKLLNEK